MASDWPSKSEVWGTFQTLSERLDDLDTHVVDALAAAVGGDNLVVIREAADLPTPVGDEHILEAAKTYLVADIVDLGANAIRMGVASSLVGLSPSTNGFITTNAAGAIRATNIGNTVLRNFFIFSPAGPALACTGPVTDHFNAFYLGFLGCASVGTITGFKVAAIKSCYTGPFGANPAGSGVTFDGTSRKTFVSDSPFEELTSGAAITLAATLVVEVIDISGNFFKYDAPLIGVEDLGATYTEGIFTNNLRDGTVTPSAGFNNATPEWGFIANTGVPNSTVDGFYAVSASAVTNFAIVDTPVKLEGTTSPEPTNQRFTHSDNRLTYTGIRGTTIDVTATAALDAAANNKQFTVYLAKNGTVQPLSAATARISAGADVRNVFLQDVVELNTGDFIELWIENNTDTTSVTALNASMMARGGLV